MILVKMWWTEFLVHLKFVFSHYVCMSQHTGNTYWGLGGFTYFAVVLWKTPLWFHSVYFFSQSSNNILVNQEKSFVLGHIM